MLSTANLVCFFAALFSALMGGLFFTWSNAVVTGLAKIPDHGYISAMQSINRTILNPLFLLIFMGTNLLLPLAAWFQYRAGEQPGWWLMALAALIYIIGVFGVTIGGNIPLNQMLDKFALSTSTAQEMKDLRTVFENRWNNLNLIRAWASAISLALVLLSLLTRTTGLKES